jgi:peptidyl-prolyl cis-trans isomerase C
MGADNVIGASTARFQQRIHLMIMSSTRALFLSIRLPLALLLAMMALDRTNAATATPPPAAATGASVLPDEVLCRGEGVAVQRSQVDRALMQYRANAMARGQTIPESRIADLEALLLDRLVVTRLLMNRATEQDRAKARGLADEFIAETVEQSGGEAAFERQLLAMSFTRDEFERQILERALCEEVVERELRDQVQITRDQVRRYYDENAEQMQRPEMVRASHILLATQDPLTGRELSDDEQQAKRREATALLERARKGEDFAALARQYSDDPGSKDQGGEYVFARGQMVPEFEVAAFSLKPDQVSDLVKTQFGYHIIKLQQRIPAEQIEFARVEEDIRESLERREIQEKLLPPFLKRLRDQAKLEYLNGGRPPPEVENGQPNP